MRAFDRLLIGLMALLFAIFGISGFIEHNRNERGRTEFALLNRAVLIHLCSLENVTLAVWRSAITSYKSLPDKTVDQRRLLAQLETGVTRIRSDRSCDRIVVSPGS